MIVLQILNDDGSLHASKSPSVDIIMSAANSDKENRNNTNHQAPGLAAMDAFNGFLPGPRGGASEAAIAGEEQQRYVLQQRSMFENMAKGFADGILKSKPCEKAKEEAKVDVSSDFFAKHMVKKGFNAFELNAFAIGIVKEMYSGSIGDITNKVMAMDGTVKRGEALTKAKFQPSMCLSPFSVSVFDF